MSIGALLLLFSTFAGGIIGILLQKRYAINLLLGSWKAMIQCDLHRNKVLYDLHEIFSNDSIISSDISANIINLSSMLSISRKEFVHGDFSVINVWVDINSRFPAFILDIQKKCADNAENMSDKSIYMLKKLWAYDNNVSFAKQGFIRSCDGYYDRMNRPALKIFCLLPWSSASYPPSVY